MWTFAHNGQLDKSLFDWPLEFYFPVGDTDSEYAFCWIMDQMRKKFPCKPSCIHELTTFLHQCCEKLRKLGVFNMLLSESNFLFTYNTTKLSWITRKAPFGEASLKDYELTVDFHTETTETDKVTVIATEPLAENEAWEKLLVGELIVFKLGDVVERRLST